MSWFYISAVLRALWEGVEDRFFRGALRAPQNCVHVDHDGLCFRIRKLTVQAGGITAAEHAWEGCWPHTLARGGSMSI